MAKTTANISIDADIKKQAQELLAELGLDLSTAVNIFLRQTLREQSIPFEITKNVPNDETVKAIREVEEMEKYPEKYKGYSSFSDLVEEVMSKNA